VVTYTLPLAASEPYALDLAGGLVWFTERSGNRIGRLDPATGALAEFAVPSAGSQPTGLDVIPGIPAQVWFAEGAGNQLGQLVVTSTTDYAWAEFLLTATLTNTWANAQMQSVFAATADSIWFTAPGANRIGNFRPYLYPLISAFRPVYTGLGSRPWEIRVDADGFPWFTEQAGSRVGEFYPTTLSNIHWYTATITGGAPTGIALGQGVVWFTEQAGDRLGQIDPLSHAIREFGLPAGSAPQGLDVDGAGCAWVAESGRSSLAAWCPPYFRFLYLPVIARDG
jgi:virginiamycin B lyase